MKDINGEWVYVFQATKLGEFHRKTQQACAYEMSCDTELIVLDNTNVRFDDFKPYILLSYLFNYTVEMVEPDTEWKYDVEECAKRNAHGVPLASIQRMRSRWETAEDCKIKMFDFLKMVKEFR